MALHYVAEEAFADLLTTWRHHDDLQRRGGCSVRQLARSRQALEHARLRMRRLREALYPTPAEANTVVMSVLCPSLDEVVHLGWSHRSTNRPGNLACPCGTLVPIR